MASLKTLQVGVDYRHGPEFVIDRPHGPGFYVFLRYGTPIRRRLHGAETVEPAGACIFYTPRCAMWYRGMDGGFQNDWLHFTGQGLPAFFRRLGLPLDRPFWPRRSDFVPVVLAELQRERLGGELHSPELETLHLQRLFLLLSRQAQSATAGGTPRQEQRREELRQLRLEMREQPQAAWSVPALARRVHLSASRFSALYRECFGLSPGEDLLQARLERAGWLLAHAGLTVGEAAAASGFKSIYYFSRLFRQRRGCSPSRYAGE